MYKILIADDKNEINDSIKEALEQNFSVAFQTMIARTGRTAIEVAESFALILCLWICSYLGLVGLMLCGK